VGAKFVNESRGEAKPRRDSLECIREGRRAQSTRGAPPAKHLGRGARKSDSGCGRGDRLTEGPVLFSPQGIRARNISGGFKAIPRAVAGGIYLWIETESWQGKELYRHGRGPLEEGRAVRRTQQPIGASFVRQRCFAEGWKFVRSGRRSHAVSGKAEG